jgi:hypothetical protein
VVCTPCDTGRYTDQAGQSSCKGAACAAGKYGTIGNTAVNACTNCTVGQFANLTATVTCASCAKGTYQDKVGQAACTVCTVGKYNTLTGKASASDCTSCAAGKASGTTGATAAAACTNCVQGKFQGQTAQAACLLCASGQYSDQAAQTACKGTACAAGKFFANAQTAAVNCTACAAGQYTDQAAQITCKGSVCVAGKYFAAAQTAAVTCSSCAKGTFADSSGLAVCKACAPGKHSDEVGQTACKGSGCAKGRYFAAGQTAPVACSVCMAGQYTDQASQASCKGSLCGVGKYHPVAQTAAVQCISCPAGQTSVSGQAGCTSLPPVKTAADSTPQEVKVTTGLGGFTVAQFTPKAQTVYKATLAAELAVNATDITILNIKAVTQAARRRLGVTATLAARRLAGASGITFDLVIKAKSKQGADVATAAIAELKAKPAKMQVFKAALKTQFGASGVNFTAADFDSFNISRVTTAASIRSLGASDKKLELAIGLGVGLGVPALGLVAYMSARRRQLDKVDPHIEKVGP